MIYNKDETFEVYSSWGRVVACKKTGCVIESFPESFEKKTILNNNYEYKIIDYCFLENIQRFFIDEFIAFYGKLENEIDIITIGYWSNECEYFPPEDEKRNMTDYIKK